MAYAGRKSIKHNANCFQFFMQLASPHGKDENEIYFYFTTKTESTQSVCGMCIKSVHQHFFLLLSTLDHMLCDSRELNFLRDAFIPFQPTV